MYTRTEAFLLRRVNYRESDLVVQLFTQALGKISALARAARHSKTRFAGSLESMHTLSVEIAESKRGDLYELRAARIERARIRLTRSLERMNAAGHVLGWVRSAAPERTPEPEVYAGLVQCLDYLDTADDDANASRGLAAAGLRLLAAFGWALDFDGCVACGTPCPEQKGARLSPSRGGLVCSACGSGGIALSAQQRRRFSNASRGNATDLSVEDTNLALRLVDETLSTHANLR